jgi:hypothetical protein
MEGLFLCKGSSGFLNVDNKKIDVKEIFEGNCLKDTLTIADSVESGLSALTMSVKAA